MLSYFICEAVEKLLKAATQEIKDEKPKKSHTLHYLAKNSGLEFSEEEIEALRVLNNHYQKVRYRDMSNVHYSTKKLIEPLLKEGQSIYKWTLEKFENR